jgi:hypothetical protein
MLTLAALVLLGAPQGARATLILESTQTDFTFATVGVNPVHSVEFIDNNPIAPGTIVGPGQPFANPDGTTNFALIGTDDNPALHTLGIGSVGTPSQVGNFLVTASLSTSATPTGQLISGATSVLNNQAGTHTNIVRVGDTNFTTPGGIVNTENIISGAFSILGSTSRPSTSDSIAITHYLDPNNNPLGGTDHPGAINIYSRTFTVGATGPRSYSDDVISGPFAAGSPYSLTAGFNVTLAHNNQLTARSNEIDVLPTPEPGTMAAILTGLPLLGIAFRRARRNPSA